MKSTLILNDTLYNLRGLWRKLQAAGVPYGFKSNKLHITLEDAQQAAVLSVLLPVTPTQLPTSQNESQFIDEVAIDEAAVIGQLNELGFLLEIDIDTDEHKHYLIKKDSGEVFIGINHEVDIDEFSIDNEIMPYWELFQKHDLRKRDSLAEVLATCLLRITEGNAASA